MTPYQSKQLAKQAGASSCEEDYFMSFSPSEIDKFVRLVRESAFTEARWAIEGANEERHIDPSDCVQIIEDLKRTTSSEQSRSTHQQASVKRCTLLDGQPNTFATRV